MRFIYVGIVYLFLVYIMLILLLNLKPPKKEERPINKNLVYYFIVPCVNEELVIRQTIQALLDFNCQGKVIAVDDGSYDRTYEIMQEFDPEKCLILKRVLPNAQKGKGLALNAALKLCIEDVNSRHIDKELVVVGVLDADGKLSVNSIDELNQSFSNKQVSAAQLRVKMYPVFKNTLQVVQDFEFFTVNNLAQSARTKTNSVGLSGNGQFFRLKPILEEIGEDPWGDSLLDDYELTLKLMMANLKIDYISKAYVYQEALSSIKKFIKQRSRWVQGNIDCLKYLKKILPSQTLLWTQKMSIYYFLSQPFLNLFADVYIFVCAIKLLSHFIDSLNIVENNLITFALSFLFVLSLSILIGGFFSFIYYINLSKHNEPLPPWSKLLILPIAASYTYIILFFSIVIAFWRQITNQRAWIKTERN